MRFWIHTCGCQMNVRDSEAVAALLLAAGHEWADGEGEILSYGGVDFVPYHEPVAVKGTKWSFAKAASVKFAKPKGAKDKTKVLQGYDDPKKPNASGLKLTYTAKKGTFKGSFKVYALQGEAGKEKLKKYTVNVEGVVVGGKGYGRATCKKPMAGPFDFRVR